MIIYKITNKVNGKFYIGKTTKTIDQRFKGHFYKHKDGNTYLYKSMRKYGFDMFQIEMIEQTDDLNVRERFWISQLKPHYNMTEGGEGGDTSMSPNYWEGLKRRPPPTSKFYLDIWTNNQCIDSLLVPHILLSFSF